MKNRFGGEDNQTGKQTINKINDGIACMWVMSDEGKTKQGREDRKYQVAGGCRFSQGDKGKPH